jgi:hypothetical protein
VARVTLEAVEQAQEARSIGARPMHTSLRQTGAQSGTHTDIGKDLHEPVKHERLGGQDLNHLIAIAIGCQVTPRSNAGVVDRLRQAILHLGKYSKHTDCYTYIEQYICQAFTISSS